jgi:hypothetical protein
MALIQRHILAQPALDQRAIDEGQLARDMREAAGDHDRDIGRDGRGRFG